MPVMTKGKLHLRVGSILIAAVVLLVLIAILAPAQLPVILWKGALVTLSGFLGYRIDRALFPYGRPDRMTQGGYDTATIRRAIVVGAAMIAFALAL